MRWTLSLLLLAGACLSAKLRGLQDEENICIRPPGFPPHVPVQVKWFNNWGLTIHVPSVISAKPASAADCVDIVNWAYEQNQHESHNYLIRPTGKHHNWSPLHFDVDTPECSDLIEVDMRGVSGLSIENEDGAYYAVVGAGMYHLDFLQELSAEGLTPAGSLVATGSATVGGIVVTGGHGTAVHTEMEPDAGTLATITANVVEFDAVVFDEVEAKYVLKHYTRADDDFAALIVSLGRSLITSLKIRLQPEPMLEVRNIFITDEELFEAPTETPSRLSFTQLLEDYGRVMVLQYFQTGESWVRVWKKTDEPDPEAVLVEGPFNYQWLQGVSKAQSEAVDGQVAENPEMAPEMGASGLLGPKLNSPEHEVFYGASMNTQLIVDTDTYRMAVFSYAFQTKRDEVQDVLHRIWNAYLEVLESYVSQDRWPQNGPCEVRATQIDHEIFPEFPDYAVPAGLSMCRALDSDKDLTLFFSIHTFPSTPDFPPFNQDLETAFFREFGVDGTSPFTGILRPEWAKGYACLEDGCWGSDEKLADIRREYNQGGLEPFTFDNISETLVKLDPANLYSNEFLDRVFAGQ